MKSRKQRIGSPIAGWVSHGIIIILIIMSIFPIYLLISMSLKSNFQLLSDIFSLPNPVKWENYDQAFGKLIRSLFNSVFLSVTITSSIVFMSAINGFVFSRFEFPGKKFIYTAILALMMVPGFLGLASLIKLIENLNLRDTWWALYLPAVAGGQIMGTVLCKNSLDGQPKELYMAAKVDGANTWNLFLKICLPLCRPILATIFVLNIVAVYNDYFSPFIFIDSMDKMPITVTLKLFQVKFIDGQSGVSSGAMYAGYVISTIPLILIFLFGSRVYVEGITSGALKV